MRKTPVVMGVLSMVFGGIQVLMTGVGAGERAVLQADDGQHGQGVLGPAAPEGQPDSATMFDQLGRLTEELKLYTYLTGFAMLAFAITLIIVGWMLYKRRAQSRR